MMYWGKQYKPNEVRNKYIGVSGNRKIINDSLTLLDLPINIIEVFVKYNVFFLMHLFLKYLCINDNMLKAGL